jgi:hypothetical protein
MMMNPPASTGMVAAAMINDNNSNGGPPGAQGPCQSGLPVAPGVVAIPAPKQNVVHKLHVTLLIPFAE